MEQELQNIHPNYEEPELVDAIRENIHFQMDQSIKHTLLKESLLKISLDKDFEHLFQPKNVQRQELFHNEPIVVSNKNHLVQVSEQIKQICSWLEDSEQYRGMAYLPFTSAPRLINILHQKVEGTTIIISEYPQFWINKMQQIGRLCKLKWGFLSEEQDSDDKIKVLELYQLKKLKLLFITPNLFKCQEYHQFQCDLLIVLDLHLYLNDSKYIAKMINKTTPGRVLTLYHTLMPLHYKQILSDNNIVSINQPRPNPFNFIVLKTSEQQKFKTMMTYLSKNEFKKVLIVVKKRQEASFLNKKLLLESKTSINLFQELSAKEINSFTRQEILKDQEKKIQEERIFQFLKKVSHSDILISKNTDFLRFCHFDIAVYYSFNDVIQFAESCFTVKEKLLLFEENDYYNNRNMITSDLVTIDNLQKLVMKMIERQVTREQSSKKRSYSNCIEDRLMNTFTVSKQFVQKDVEKVLRINSFCRRYEISNSLMSRIIQSLEINKVIGINYRTVYQIEIDLDSISRLKRQFPAIEQVRRRVNLLNISTSMHKTIRNILQDLKNKGIKYRVTQQALQMKIYKDYDDIDWQCIHGRVNEQIYKEAYSLDKSFQIFKNCAYSSIELTRRQKILHKKEYMLNFFTHNDVNKDNSINTMESYHKSNLLTSEIEEWIRHSEQVMIDEHDLVLLLQGVERGRVSKFKEDPVFGRYRRLKYEELMDAINKIYNNKKLKTE